VDSIQQRILVDLSKAYRDKIRHAAAHMHEMCEMADIPEEAVFETISTVTLFVLTAIIDSKTDMSAEDFGAYCAESLQQRRAVSRPARRGGLK
jgi:hypothetical protein